MHKDYIGDGVYVEWNGYAIVMTTEREHGTDRIELDSATYEALVRYATRIKELVADQTATA